MRFLPLLLSVVLTAASFGADDYLPLAVGNEWIMDAVLTSPQGEVSKTTARRRTGGTTEYEGKVYHRVVTALEGLNATAYTKLYRKDETGFYSVDVRDETAKEQTEVV